METKVIDQRNWHVVYTYPNTERRIYRELIRREITAFLPTKKEIRQWSDRKKKLEVPLFPSYVFVKIHAKEIWVVAMVEGVARFVSFNGRPAVVKESEVDLIKKIISGTGNVRNESNCLIEGDHVQIQRGPLAGLEGRVMCTKGKNRLYITLTSLNKVISVEIDTFNLVKITNRAVSKSGTLNERPLSTSI